MNMDRFSICFVTVVLISVASHAHACHQKGHKGEKLHKSMRAIQLRRRSYSEFTARSLGQAVHGQHRCERQSHCHTQRLWRSSLSIQRFPPERCGRSVFR